jgi:hypothetical protein
MPLLGRAAMLLLFDVAPDAIAEHDDWHTHEHLPERLAIPGFLRGTRWIATHGAPRYMVVYEVADLATLTSAPYLARPQRAEPVDDADDGALPRHATRVLHRDGKLRPRRGQRGPARSLHAARRGRGLASAMARRGECCRRCRRSRPGQRPPARGCGDAADDGEQRIRGADAVVEGVEGAVIVTGYRADELRDVTIDAARHGATEVGDTMYRLDYSLAAGEVAR